MAHIPLLRRLFRDRALEPPPRKGYDGFISYSRTASEPLAKALESALETIARPWYRVGGLRIFRDRTGLGATSDLRHCLHAHIDASAFLVLLASRRAAKSEWVDQELRYWFETLKRSCDKVVVVLTEGEVPFWLRRGERFDPATSQALPPVYLQHCRTEPAFVDLRWAGELPVPPTLHAPRFLDAVADIATPLLGKNSKDEVISEERQRRRKVRLATGAGLAILAGLGLATYFFADLQARTTRSESLATQADQRLRNAPAEALLLAAGANTIQPTDNARRALLAAALRTRGLVGIALGQAAAIKNLQFIAPGTLLSADADGEMRRWKIDPGASRLVQDGAPRSFGADFADLDPKPSRVETDIIFSPDGRWLLAVNGAHTTFSEKAVSTDVKLVGLGKDSFSTPPDLAESLGSESYFLGASANGRQLLYMGSDGVFRRWDVDAGQPAIQSNFAACGERFGSTFISADGSTGVCTGSYDSTLAWDLKQDKELAKLLTTEQGHIAHVALSRDGGIVALADLEFGLRIVRLRPSLIIGEQRIPSTGDVLALSFDDSGRNLAVALAHGELQIWSIGGGYSYELRERFDIGDSPPQSLAFSSDSRLVAIGRSDGAIMAWRTDAQFDLSREFGGGLGVAMSADDRRLALTSTDDPPGAVTLKVLEVSSSEQIGEPFTPKWPILGGAFDEAGTILRIFGRQAIGKCRLGDDEKLVVASLDLQSQTKTESLSRATRCSIGQVHVAPHGVVIASEDGIALWRANADIVDLWHPPPAFIFMNYAFATSVDGARVAFDVRPALQPSAPSVIEIWDTNGEAPRRITSIPLASVVDSFALSADGGTLLALTNGRIDAWTIGGDGSLAARDIAIDAGHGSDALALDPTDRLLAVDRPGTIDLWDLSARRRIGTVPAGSLVSTASFAFSPSGQYLVTTVAGTGTKVWDLRPDSWMSYACRFAAPLLGTETAFALFRDDVPDGLCTDETAPAPPTTSSTSG